MYDVSSPFHLLAVITGIDQETHLTLINFSRINKIVIGNNVKIIIMVKRT